MSRAFVAALALFTVGAPALAAPGSTAGSDKGAPNYLRMKKATLVDQHGFEKPVPALTLLIPTDWKFEGRVDWYKAGSCRTNGLNFIATGPDGRSLQLFPDYDFQWSDDPNMVRFAQQSSAQAARSGARACGVMKPMDAATFLKGAAAPQVVPHDQLVSVDPLPKANEQLKGMDHQREAQMGQAGLRIKVSSDAARARLTGTQDGKATEEWLMAIVENVATPSPVGRGASYQSNARFLYLFRAPKGHLDESEKLLKTMLGSVQLNPEWLGRVQQNASQIAAIRAKGARDRAKIVSDTQRDIAAIRQSSVDYRQQVQDQQFKKFDQNIRGVETYRDPSTGEKVELSNQYGHAWVSGTGEYLLSDSPNFDPNSVSNQTWTRMQQADP